MAPTLTQLERSGVPIRHIDVTSEPDLARRYGVRSTPTFIVISGGEEVTRLVGAQPLVELRRALTASSSGPLIPTRAFEADARRDPRALTDPIAARPRANNAPPTPRQRSEVMPSISLADAVQRAEAATVRLRVHDGHGYGAGTGTIIDTHGEDALVLTCGHLFRENEGEGKIEVDLFYRGETRTVMGRLVDFDADVRDVALVEIRPGFNVEPVEILTAEERVRNGSTAFSFGCDRGADPTRRDTRITGVDKYNQHLGVSNLEIAGAPIDGRSGGGLFDDHGRLIGVCNAADYKSDVGIYAGPGSVHWQLERVGLENLYQRQPGMRQPTGDRIASLPGSAGRFDQPIRQPLRQDAVAPARFDQGTQAVDQEVIVIVRDRNNPDGGSRVMTLDRPSADLMQMIQRHSRN